MPAPRAPGVGDSIEKWELWIKNYSNYLNENNEVVPYGLDKKFDTFKTKEIKKFGTGWNTALRFGDDKKYINVMENNWKYTTYVTLKGVKPKTFGMKSYI